jgi:hypothetical protein
VRPARHGRGGCGRGVWGVGSAGGVRAGSREGVGGGTVGEASPVPPAATTSGGAGA